MKIYLIRGETTDGEPSGFNKVLSVHIDPNKAEQDYLWFTNDPYQKKRYWGVYIDEWETE